MRDFPSCFSENGVQIAANSSSISTIKSSQNLVTCIYKAKLHHHSYTITITWIKNLMGPLLSIQIQQEPTSQTICTLTIKPWNLFSKCKGSKTFDHSTKIDILWDLTLAKFQSSPQPQEGFYLTFLFDNKIVLLLGDMVKEAQRKTSGVYAKCNAVFVSKKEHVFGKRVHCTKARFKEGGGIHDVEIECDVVGVEDPVLEIRVDGEGVLKVERIGWKFRGNEVVCVDGVGVEVFWDVYSWVFGGNIGNAVFMFRSSDALGFSLILYAWKSD